MGFIDEIDIYISSGKGGDGLFCFSGNRFSSYKIPNGGNGGNGGNVYLVGDKNCFTFYKLKFRSNYKAEDGYSGQANCKTGKNGCDLNIYVPLGTKVYDKERKIFLGEIFNHNDSFLVACGGKSGYGNFFLRCYKNPSENLKFGSKAELKYLHLELNLLSNVGLLGFPNVGKSSFINNISNSSSEVSNYSFTTLKPVLGVLKFSFKKKIVIADIPGIIEFSSQGTGLGFKFLKHLSKTILLLHVLDISSVTTLDSFIKEIFIINRELQTFNNNFVYKEKWLVLNKVDLIDKLNVKIFMIDFLKKFNYKSYFLISSKKKIGFKKICFNINQYFFKKK